MKTEESDYRPAIMQMIRTWKSVPWQHYKKIAKQADMSGERFFTCNFCTDDEPDNLVIFPNKTTLLSELNDAYNTNGYTGY